MSTFDEALATILAEHKALQRENELLKKKLAEAEETIAIIKIAPNATTFSILRTSFV